MSAAERVGLTPEQVGFLLRPLHPDRVQHANGQSHLAAWDVRRHLLRVFGWGGWSFEVLSCDVVSERTVCQNPDAAPTAQRFRSWVVYRVLGRLTILDSEGVELARFEDGATGDAANQPSLGDAHDMALKTAMSQALKRCAVNLGDAFGLSLYNGGSPQAVVHGTLAHPRPEQTEQAGGELPTEPVQAGEDDAHAQAAPAVEPQAEAKPVPPGVDPATGEVTEPQAEAPAPPVDPKVQRAADLAAKAWRVRKVESLKSDVYDVAHAEGLLRVEAPHPREDGRRLPLAALITVRKAELLGAAEDTREDVPA